MCEGLAEERMPWPGGEELIEEPSPRIVVDASDGRRDLCAGGDRGGDEPIGTGSVMREGSSSRVLGKLRPGAEEFG